MSLIQKLPGSFAERLGVLMDRFLSALLGLLSVQQYVISGKENFDKGVQKLHELGLLESLQIETVASSSPGEAFIRKAITKSGKPVYGVFHFSRDPSAALSEATRAFFQGKI